MLIPNRRYCEVFPDNVDVANTVHSKSANLLCAAKSLGTTYCVNTISQAIGMRDILYRCLPDSGAQILAVASYMLCEGSVMMYLRDWCDDTDVYFSCGMDDWGSSRPFASLSHESRMQFFREWTKQRFDKECIVYDVRSISTHSKGIDDAEWGCNRDEEKLPKISLGVFGGAQSRLPVFHTTYSGSINDTSRL